MKRVSTADREARQAQLGVSFGVIAWVTEGEILKIRIFKIAVSSRNDKRHPTPRAGA
jgi:hypothetical protein